MADTMADALATWGGWAPAIRDDPFGHFAAARARCPVQRVRLRAERLGAGWFTVEQQAYADTDDSGRIARLDLLCTGYRPEGGHD